MSNDKVVYIVGACRTPIGSFCGTFNNIPAHDLGSIVIKDVLKKAKVNANDVSEVIMGQTLTAGQGQNPARLAALNAGIPVTVPAYGVNMLCGSGLKAIYLAWQAIMCGEAKVAVAGGQENMSIAPHCASLRNGTKLGPSTFHDTVHVDGLVDPILNMHMGETADRLVQKYAVPRVVQDKYALYSQLSADKAIRDGHFVKEIVPVTVKTSKHEFVITEDEYPKRGLTIAKLHSLKPVFGKGEGATITAGNASGINDGAAAIVLCNHQYYTSHNLNELAKIVAFAQVGLEPVEMGLGPVIAIPKLLEKAGWMIDDVDLFEINEAFAVQAYLCITSLHIPEEKVNISGGAIALGHPLGASGARVLVTLLHNLERLNLAKGVASLCIGGGMGIAIAVERNIK